MIAEIPELLLQIFHFVDKLSLLKNVALVSREFYNCSNYEFNKHSTFSNKVYYDFKTLPFSSKFSTRILSPHKLDYETGLLFYLSRGNTHDGDIEFTIEMSHILQLNKSIHISATISDGYSDFFLAEIPSVLTKNQKKVKVVILTLSNNKEVVVDYTNLNDIKKHCFDNSFHQIELIPFSTQTTLQEYFNLDIKNLSWHHEIITDYWDYFYIKSLSSPNELFLLFSLPEGIISFEIDKNLNKKKQTMETSFQIWPGDVIMFKNNSQFVGIRNHDQLLIFDVRKFQFEFEFNGMESNYFSNPEFYLIQHNNNYVTLLFSRGSLVLIGPKNKKRVQLKELKLTTIALFDESLGFIFIKHTLSNKILRAINVWNIINNEFDF